MVDKTMRETGIVLMLRPLFQLHLILYFLKTAKDGFHMVGITKHLLHY